MSDRNAWMLAFALRADGWFLRSDIIWHKPNPMPESISDRPTSKRNSRNVWTIASQPFSGAHFATMPPALAERCIKAGSKAGDTILDPFGGAGTTGLVADRLGRDSILIELNPAYAEMARARIHGDAPLLGSVA